MDDCFDKILKASSKSEVTQYKVLIKLMKDLEEGISNTLRFRNCLLFLINLCFEQKYCDYTDRIGKNALDLSKNEKNQMLEILSWEVNN
ncbi:MAG: hypothetical protein ACFFAI_10825 [Promethearchaeota archaeon]